MTVPSHTCLFTVYVVLERIFIAVSVLINYWQVKKQFICIIISYGKQVGISSYEIYNDEHCSGNNFTYMLRDLSYKLEVLVYLPYLSILYIIIYRKN